MQGLRVIAVRIKLFPDFSHIHASLTQIAAAEEEDEVEISLPIK